MLKLEEQMPFPAFQFMRKTEPTEKVKVQSHIVFFQLLLSLCGFHIVHSDNTHLPVLNPPAMFAISPQIKAKLKRKIQSQTK